jgi:hypothetical protein
MGKKTEVKTEVRKENKLQVEVNAMDFLRGLGLDWIVNGLEEADIDRLGAKVTMADSGEWANFTHPYYRVDGKYVPGLFWGISVPIRGGVVILRLVEGNRVRASLKVWPTNKGILEGEEAIIKALLGRKDIKLWTTKDTASLL